MNIFISNKLYVKKSNIPNAGYGVFTREYIEEGEIIEVAKFIKIENRLFDRLYNDIDSIGNVLYGFPKNNHKCFSIVLGYGSIYNSSLDSKTNNVDWKTDEDSELFIYYSLCGIKKDEELFIFYSNYEYNENTIELEDGK